MRIGPVCDLRCFQTCTSPNVRLKRENLWRILSERVGVLMTVNNKQCFSQRNYHHALPPASCSTQIYIVKLSAQTVTNCWAEWRLRQSLGLLSVVFQCVPEKREKRKGNRGFCLCWQIKAENQSLAELNKSCGIMLCNRAWQLSAVLREISSC